MLDKEQVFFLGGVFLKNYLNIIEKNSKDSIQYAANNLQWSMIEGLDANLCCPVYILNEMFIGSYPKRYTEKKIDTFKWNHSEDSTDINIGFYNLILYKHLSRILNGKKIIKKIFKKNKKNKILFIYSVNSAFMDILKYLKKRFYFHACLVVPDLPQYMYLNNKKNFIYTILKKIEIAHIKKNLKYVDSFVLLTKEMNQEINFLNKPYCVIEGMVNICEKKMENEENEKNAKILFYSGTLNERYGVKNLVDAFLSLGNCEIKLQICGCGDQEEYIKRCTAKDKRIEYLGLIPNEKVVLLQKNAILLVNPRPTKEEFTKYSFPSKNLEYMVSGTPVLTTKLSGIPKEYDNYVYFIEDESVDGIAKKIQQLLSKPIEELNEKGRSAKEFVLNKKNNILQTKKILDMINDDKK